MSCGNSDILALIDYFQNGTDLSSNSWDNYNYYDLWNAIENGVTPPERIICGTFVQADIRSIVFAVLGVFTSPSDYLGDNIDFYYLYLKAIGQEVVSPKFSNFCIGQLYDLFSIGLTAKFRQGQDFNVTMSKVAAIASITFEQGQQLDALLSKSAAIQNAVFEQQQTFNVDLSTFTGLLDLYPNAAAAYSVRLLSSTYSGPLVRIRKDTGGQPEKDFYADSNNELSLNSSDGGGTTLGNWIGNEDGYVVTWYSQTGSNDATNGSASTQPKLINAGSFITMSGKPTLQGNTARKLDLSTPLTTLSEFSMYIIGGNSTSGRMVADNNSFDHFIEGGTSSNRIRIVSVVNLSSRIFQNNSILSWDRNGTNASVYENNVLNTSTTSMGTNNAEFGQLFNVNSSGANGTDGQMSEVIIWPSDKSNNRSGITNSINEFYSIY